MKYKTHVGKDRDVLTCFADAGKATLGAPADHDQGYLFFFFWTD